MNLETELIFIVGPGGAGKSTTGKILAQKTRYNFVDVDLFFCQRIALIPDYVHQFGYKQYCETNSSLVDDLLKEFTSQAIIALPSGFLVHEESPELVTKHKQLLAESGVSILLLPSDSLEICEDIIVTRQLSRGFSDIKADRERQVIKRRHPLYLQEGDIKVFSHQTPNEIANLMIQALNKLGLPKHKRF